MRSEGLRRQLRALVDVQLVEAPPDVGKAGRKPCTIIRFLNFESLTKRLQHWRVKLGVSDRSDENSQPRSGNQCVSIALDLCEAKLEPAMRQQEAKVRWAIQRCSAVPVGSSCGQQADDVFDCFIGPMVGSLKSTVGSVLRIGLMVKATVGEGTT